MPKELVRAGKDTARARTLTSPFAALCAALAFLVLFFAFRPLFANTAYYAPRSATDESYWFLVAAAFVPYALALRSTSHGDAPSARTLLLAVAVLYLLAVPVAAQQSQDVYQALLYGKMALIGHNPYTTDPDTFRDSWSAWARWTETASVYGPAWTAVTEGVVRIAGTRLTRAFLLLKLVTASLAILASWLLSRIGAVESARPHGLASDPRFAVVAFAYNPMVFASVAFGAHADIAVAAGVAGAMLADARRHPMVASLLLAGATLVKPYAGLVAVAWLASLAWRRGLVHAAVHAGAMAIVGVVGWVPFWKGPATIDAMLSVGRMASTSPTGTLIRLASGSLPDAAAAGASPAGTAIRAVSLLLLVLSIVAVARWERTRNEPWRAAGVLFTAYLMLTPWYLPWHLIGLVAIAAVVSDTALRDGTLTFSGTSLFVGAGPTAFGLIGQCVARYAPPFVISLRAAGSSERNSQRARRAG
jgi:hypothetical protein